MVSPDSNEPFDRLPYDGTTGEVLSPETVAQLAADYAGLTESLHEAEREVKRLESKRRHVESQLMGALDTGQSLDAGAGRSVVRVPGSPGRRSVDKDVALEHIEVLEDLGLARRKLTVTDTSIKQIDAHRGELIKAGVPYDRLAPPAPIGPDEIMVVT